MRKMKLDYQQTELKFKQKREAAKLKANEMKINKKPSGSQFVIALDCNIYQAVQKIGASSRGDQGYKSLLFTVSQEKKNLRFIGYDFESCNVFDFSYPAEESRELVVGFKSVSKKEIEIQLQMGLLNAEYRDLPGGGGGEGGGEGEGGGVIEGIEIEGGREGEGGDIDVVVKKEPPKFYITFGMEQEGENLEIHMTEAEEKRAAANLDEMMNASAQRQQSRQHSAEHRLQEQEKNAEWGQLDEEV